MAGLVWYGLPFWEVFEMCAILDPPVKGEELLLLLSQNLSMHGRVSDLYLFSLSISPSLCALPRSRYV